LFALKNINVNILLNKNSKGVIQVLRRVLQFKWSPQWATAFKQAMTEPSKYLRMASSGLNLLFILYDGIENSIFDGQVLAPLLERLKKNKNLHVTIVSFEKKLFFQKILKEKFENGQNKRLKIFVLKKLPFIGKISLWFAVLSLKRFLRKVYKKNFPDEIIARGPFAGSILRKTLPKKYLSRLTIQARGLAAEEFRFVQERVSSKRFFKFFFYHLYKSVEIDAYKKSSPLISPSIKIETVSSALKDFLVKEFGADETMTFVSYKDVPEKISGKKILRWRKLARKELCINKSAYVYCYSGSALLWQSVDEMLDFFSKKIVKNKNCFLLILSKDKEIFEKKLQKLKIAKNNYLILSVKHENIYRYLSAADAGLLFREDDIVNFVSRPTKILEYRVVGLDVIHNNTISWLKKDRRVPEKGDQ
jgi:hypothetical protein